RLLFPTTEPSVSGYAGFNFTLSSTSETEGPQGSFECVHRTYGKCLESLGAMQCKMRIQAKDDVYEATRHRMAVVENNYKKNCTREIKPGGPGIGRKVKVKAPVIPPGRRERELPVPFKHNYSPKPSNNGLTSSPHHGIINGNSMPNVAHTKPQGNNHAQKPGNPDIMKRPLRERLIHILAVRPHKKPELYDKIMKDGLRDRDKNNLANVLKLVSCMKGNTYTLTRHVWNDVQEDWPFYTEQERQSMKRHKPQNLTPPGSSDGGSSGSGQSPTSTHPGSPPSTISSSNMKRPGYIDGADGLTTKRQRISHYQKPSDLSSMTSRLPDSSQQQRSTVADSSSQSDDFYKRNNRDRRDAIKTNPRNREYNGSRGFGSGGGGSGDGNNSNGDALSRNGYYDSSLVSSAMNGSGPENEENDDKRCSSGGYDSSVVANKARATENGNGVLSQSSSRGPGGHHDNRNSRWSNRVTSTTQKSSGSGFSPDSQLENVDSGTDKESKETAASSSTEYPEYLLSYSSIHDNEQRKRYKADFTAHYKEYRDLHAEVEGVSKRFAQLEDRLRQEEKNSPAWREIKNQIVREYQENKRDLMFQEHKRRFQYLHEKLSHIKRLVLEYDTAVASDDMRKEAIYILRGINHVK
ncbi:hypothetical protein L9F63_004236, partial [Diploptera punctata]